MMTPHNITEYKKFAWCDVSIALSWFFRSKKGWSCSRVILIASQHYIIAMFHITYETKHVGRFHDEFIVIAQKYLTCYFLECGYANRMPISLKF